MIYESEPNEVREVLYVGVDLGTSRSSVSASNGERYMVESYVGWPADMVARKVLQKEVLVGREALDNRLMLDLFRPLERGLIKEGSDRDTEAVRELLTRLLALAARPGLEEVEIRAVVGVPAEALRHNKQQLRQAMQGIVGSMMIVSEPFAVAYGLEALLHSLVIDIGAGTSDFCIMKGRYPAHEDQRTLANAGDHVDDQLLQQVRDRYPETDVSLHMAREWKERFSFVGEPAEKVLVTAPVKGRPTEIDITHEMRTACESLLPPIIETTLDLISKVEPEYQASVRKGVILSGGTALIRGLGEALQDALDEVGGGQVRVVKDPVFVGSDGGLSIALDAPPGDWDQLLT